MSKERTNTEKLYDVIKKPLITEKSVGATTMGQYTFEVNKDATKVEIAQFICRHIQKEWATNSAERTALKKLS